MRRLFGSRRRRRLSAVTIIVAAALSAALVTAIAATPSSADGPPDMNVHGVEQDGLGITPGRIKHVWLIILENKSYDATFTGLNNNTYLWQTLPSQGVLLKNYTARGTSASTTTSRW